MVRTALHPVTWIVCLAHGGGVLVGAVALRGMWEPQASWLFRDGQRAAFTAVVSVSIACCALALWLEWRRRPAAVSALRHLFVVACGWAALQWGLANRFHAVLALVAGSAALLGFALLRLSWPWLRPHLARGLPQRLDRWVFQLALVVVLLEGGLRVVGRFTTSPFFGLLDEDEREMMRHFRLAPGAVYLGFPCNADGYYDDDFAPGTGAGDVVVSIGDSFAVGVVPHLYHFTTVCEREVPGVRVHNLGVSGIGPAGYHSLLLDPGLSLRPDAIVVHLFLGNDVGNSSRWQDRRSVWASILDRRNIRAIQVPLRLWRARGQAMVSVSANHAVEPGREPRANETTPVPTADALRRAFPWLDDPLLEPPAFTPQAYLAMEVDRARRLAEAPARGLYRSTFAALAAIHEACGATPFGVVLIPDEFQVEDELWSEVETAAALTMARDEPQRIVAQWLEQQGIPFVDLLPELRALPPLADGRRHAYHLRDAHFNRRGNAVAGRMLATLVRRLLGR